MKTSRFLLLVLFIVGCFLYISTPNTYDFNYCVSFAVIYVLSVVVYIRARKKSNYFDFDMLFLFACFFVFFAYPVFVYPIDPMQFYIMTYDFNQDLITKGTGLALLGLQAYMLGGESVKSYTSSVDELIYIPHKILDLISVLSFLLFFVTIDRSFFSSSYSYDGGVSGVAGYILLLLLTSLNLSAISMFMNKRNVTDYKYNYFLLILTLLFIAFSLYLGMRTYAITIVLLYVALFSTFVCGISLRAFTFLCILGVIALSAVGMLRSGGSVAFTGIMEPFMDLIINSRNTYVALEYVDVKGYTYGLSMLGPLLSGIPFVQSLFLALTGIEAHMITSSGLLTNYTLGSNPPLGLGSNIIADLYVSFGFVGVVVGMYILGRFVTKHQNNINRSKYSCVIYFMLLSQCLYMSRGEYFSFIRFLVWGILLVYFTQEFQKKRVKECD